MDRFDIALQRSWVEHAFQACIPKFAEGPALAAEVRVDLPQALKRGQLDPSLCTPQGVLHPTSEK